MDLLPLEFLDPKFVLYYLPPGTSTPNPFWKLYYKLNDSLSLDEYQLFRDVYQEYFEELNLPVKALIIIKEASQKRGIPNLSELGMKAVNKNFSS